MPRIKLEVGQEYDVHDYRKGKFRMRVTRVGDGKVGYPNLVDDDSVDGVIVSGTASYIMRQEGCAGDNVSTRRVFARFRRIPKEPPREP